MKKSVFISFLLFAISISAQELPRYIEVSGASQVFAEADEIFFNIRIHNISESLEDSRKINVESTNALIEIFKSFKVAKDDWEVSPVKFGKEYSYAGNEKKQIGYYTNVLVSFTLKDFDNYYALIKRLSANPLFEIVQSDYKVSHFLALHKKATINAVQAAKEKAEYMAQSLGLKVGKVIQITELNQPESYGHPLNTVSLAGRSDEQVSGKISITRRVQMKIELID